MPSINRKKINENDISLRKFLGLKCVFISHQKNDTEYAKKIADFLLNNEIDVYFDEYDEDLKGTNQYSQPDKVTNAILKGINSSSHMLVIVSPNTMYSNWVPFEIGFGYDKTDLGVLTIKGIEKGKLPSYLRAAKRIRDIYDINLFVERLTGKKEDDLKKSFVFEHYNSSYHPLKNIMDEIISGE